MPYIESPFKHTTIPTVPLFINSTIGYHDKTEAASLANHLSWHLLSRTSRNDTSSMSYFQIPKCESRTRGVNPSSEVASNSFRGIQSQSSSVQPTFGFVGFLGCVASPFFMSRGIISDDLARLINFRHTGHCDRFGS